MVTCGDCANCPFGVEGRPPHTPVAPWFPPQATDRYVLPALVGEIPDEADVEAGRPFTGQTGAQLDKELAAAGLDRGRLVIVFAAACNPPKVRKSEPMIRQAVAACQPLFWSYMVRLAPDVPVLAMGRWAHYALTGKSNKVMSARGFIRQEYRLVPPTTTQQEESGPDSGDSPAE